MERKPTSRPGRAPSGCASRRMFVRLSLLAPAAAWAGAAPAQEPEKKSGWEKASKDAAGYIQKTEASAQTCASCHQFLDPDECIIVESPVSPLGWCNWYED